MLTKPWIHDITRGKKLPFWGEAMGAHGACILVLFRSCAHSRFLDACHAVFLIVLLFDILHHLFRFRCLHVDDPATLVDVTLFDALVATFVFIA